MILLENDYSEEEYAKAEAAAKEDGFSELSEFSARARKKKRIYKRKKTEKKPDA